MRLGDFTLQRYGPFEHLELPFDPTPGRVNLVVAPNGFGKSVIRRSIADFLFGIEVRTAMNFRFGSERMRILADVIDDGTQRRLERRKGNGNTLSTAGADIQPEEALRLLGGASKTTFQELFGLDTTLLRSGGQDLINTQGRLGQVLFAAGGSLGRIRDLMTDLERKRDELGKATARHKSRPIWSALSNWEQSSADLRRLALRPDGWTALERKAADTACQLETLLRAQTQDSAERDRIRTISACRPWLERLTAAQAVLTEASDAPDLDEAFEKRWRDALEANVKSTGAAAAATTELQAANDARANLNFDPAWIAAGAEIDALADLRGVAIQSEADLPKRQRELEASRTRALDLRRDLSWDETVRLPPAAIVKDAHRRLQQQPKLAAEAAIAQNRLTDADSDLGIAVSALDALPEPADVTLIADLLTLLRTGGDPALPLEAAGRKLLQENAKLQAAMSAIPDCPLPEAVLRGTAAPSEAGLEACGNALMRVEGLLEQSIQLHAARLADIASHRARLEALERSAMLPSRDALPTARAHRDAIWAMLLDSSDSTVPLEPSTIVALDRAIREADTVADALIAHGREAAEANALRDGLAVMEAEQVKAAEAVTQAERAVAQARAALLAIARTAGGHADTMPALRAFLKARGDAVACRDARDAAAAELAETERRLMAQGGRLAEAMGVVLPDLSTLSTLLAEADRRITVANDLANRRQACVDQAAKHRMARATAAAAATKAERALSDWAAQWLVVARALARPDTESPAAAIDAIGRIEELRAVEQTGGIAQNRIDEMHGAIGLLGKRIAQLHALSPELASLAPIEAADAFKRRLETEQRDAARCADADGRIEQATAKLSKTEGDVEAAMGALCGLRAAMRAETDNAAERQLQRARAVAVARADIAEARRELAIQGGGLSLDTLTARALETTADTDAARISEIDARQQSRFPKIEAARDASVAAAAALDQAGSGMDAAEAAQRREAAQAMLARTAEEALLLHATHALLQAALDRQAATADQPLLRRISDVFRIITGGAQAGVRIEETKEGQTMVALEADGATRKSLDQLSEGTCDQLYLALRVAALEEYATTASPLPFIADDVLQTFDDARTTATLRALLELSDRVQVIVLTHHRHVGDLAARLPKGAVRVMHLDAACAIV